MTAYIVVGLVDAEKASTYSIPHGISKPAGVGDYTGELCVLTSVTPLETESVLLDDTVIPDGAQVFESLETALRVGDMMIRRDRRLWPPLNPVVAEVRDGHLDALLLPPEAEKSDRLVRDAALRYGVAVQTPEGAVVLTEMRVTRDWASSIVAITPAPSEVYIQGKCEFVVRWECAGTCVLMPVGCDPRGDAELLAAIDATGLDHARRLRVLSTVPTHDHDLVYGALGSQGVVGDMVGLLRMG